MNPLLRKMILLLCLSLLSQLVMSESSHASSARSSSITVWGDCGGGTRDWWDDMCMKWRKTMGSKGWSQWWRNYELVTIERYVDPDLASWGGDKYNIDAGDAAVICTHGSSSPTTGWSGTMHHRSNGECGLDSNQMLIGPNNGNGNLRFLHLSSCNSGRFDHRLNWFGPASARVHVITGFHGYMYIGSQYVDEYGDLANRGFGTGVGKVWMEEMYHEDHWYNSYANICPMSFGFGDTQSAGQNAQNERYNSDWSDKAANWMNTRYYQGCDPSGGSALPN